MPISYRSISYTIKIGLFHSFFNDDREKDVIHSLESYNSTLHPGLKLKVVKTVDFYKKGIEFFKTYIEPMDWVGNVDLIVVAPYYSSIIAAPAFGNFLKFLLQSGVSLVLTVGAVEKDERFGVCGEIEKFFPCETGKLKYSKPENCEFLAINPRHFIMHDVNYFNGGQISHRNKITFKVKSNNSFEKISIPKNFPSTSTASVSTPVSSPSVTPTGFPSLFSPTYSPSTSPVGTPVDKNAILEDEQIDSEKNELVAVWNDKKKTPLVVTKTIRGRNKKWGTICVLNFRIWNNTIDIIGYQQNCDAPKIMQNSVIWATTKGQQFLEKRRKIKEADKSFLKNLQEISLHEEKQRFVDCELIIKK